LCFLFFTRFLNMPYSFLSTTMVHLVARVAMVPRAASQGAIITPTTPMVAGISRTTLPCSSFTMILVMLPSRISSLTFSMRLAAETENSSLKPYLPRLHSFDRIWRFLQASFHISNSTTCDHTTILVLVRLGLLFLQLTVWLRDNSSQSAQSASQRISPSLWRGKRGCLG